MSRSATKSQPEYAVTANISDRDLDLILDALPVRPYPREKQVLALIVKAWFIERLPTLQNENVKEAVSRRQLTRKIAAAASVLLELIEAAGRDVHDAISSAIIVEQNLGRYEWLKVERAVQLQREFLRDYASAADKASRGRRGRRQNRVARQAIIDLAEIFRYATSMTPTRNVDRVEGNEQGPFAHFCGAVWPVAFGSDDGLSAALRNYQEHRNRDWVLDLNETFLEMLHRVHPEWGIFEW